MRTIKIVMVGVGKQGVKSHKAAIDAHPGAELVGICDLNRQTVSEYENRWSCEGFTDIDKMIAETRPEVAIVAIPHDQHLTAVKKLSSAGVHIIKEKPFATTLVEAKNMADVLRANGTKMIISVQRRFDSFFQRMVNAVTSLGTIYAVEAKYTKNIRRLDEGWRATKLRSGGGALLDMGYHYVDLIIWALGQPSTVIAQTSLGNREGQLYDVEDTAFLCLSYAQNHPKSDERFAASLLVSRAFPEDQESLLIVGRQGTISFRDEVLTTLDSEGNILGKEVYRTNGDALSVQLQQFIQHIRGEAPEPPNSYKNHFEHVRLIEAAYHSSLKNIPIRLSSINHYEVAYAA